MSVYTSVASETGCHRPAGMRCVTKEHRKELQEWLIEAKNKDKIHLDYDTIRPPAAQNMNEWLSPRGQEERHVPYSTLLQSYDIRIKPRTVSAAASMTQPGPKLNLTLSPSAQKRHKKELVRLVWLWHGEIPEKIAARYISRDLRQQKVAGNGYQFGLYLTDLERVGGVIRGTIVNDRILPLITYWITKDSAYVDLPSVETIAQRMAFWVTKLREDPSVVPWVLSVFKTTLNLRYYYQEGEPIDDDEMKARGEAKGFFTAKVLWFIDMVYCGLLDFVPDKLGKYKEFQNAVTQSFKLINEIEHVRDLVFDIENVASYTTLNATRRTRGPGRASSASASAESA